MTTDITTAQVRRVLKAAGLTPAKRDVSKVVRGYSTVTTQGFALNYETEYRMKQHVRTGRVRVHLLLSSWRPKTDAAHRDLETAKAALEAAGFHVAENGTPHTLVVAKVVA